MITTLRNLWRRLRRAFRWVMRRRGWRTLLAAAAGAALAIILLGHARFAIDAFRVELSASFGASGVTRVDLPPLGQIWAQTHRGPLAFTVTLDDIDPDLLKAMLGQDAQTQVVPQIARQLRHDAELFAAWLLLVGAAGGAAGVLVLLRHRHWRRVLSGGALGLVLVGAAVGWSYRTYDVTAFRAPHFEGAIKAAPWVINLVDQGVSQARKLSHQLTMVAANLDTLFGSLDTLHPLERPSNQVTVLLVSDIHNNPASPAFIRRVVKAFRPDFVLDTGDLTDYGTALEVSLQDGLGSYGVPYVLVPGNHESPKELAALQGTPDLTILSTGEITVAGVPIVGQADPASTRLSPHMGTAQEISAETRALDASLKDAAVPPAILAVHNPKVALQFMGRVPVVVAGHTHRLEERERRGSVYLNPGSTGAAGIRGLMSANEIPYSLILLYLNKVDGHFVPRAADMVQVANVAGTMTLQRHLFPVATDGSRVLPALPSETGPPADGLAAPSSETPAEAQGSAKEAQKATP